MAFFIYIYNYKGINMNISNDFYENNKIALMEELGNTIIESNSILNDIINNNPRKNKNPSDEKMMIALGHKLGYLSAVFNQISVFTSGETTQKEERKIGFGSMLKKAE